MTVNMVGTYSCYNCLNPIPADTLVCPYCGQVQWRADRRSEGLSRDHPVRRRADRLELVQRRTKDARGHVTAVCSRSFSMMQRCCWRF
jgi:hypothetical protein